MSKETTGGAIDLEMFVETGALDKALKQSIDKIKKTGDEAVQQGKRIDEAFSSSTRALNEQKETVKRLESAYKSLREKADGMVAGKAKYEIINQAKQLKKEWQSELEMLNKMELAVKKNEAAHASLLTQKKAVERQMQQMMLAGKENTAEYKALAIEVGRLTDVMNDVKAQANILAHDQGGFQGVISAISGVAGGFSAAQGAMGLFAGENENLQKIMLKVQSLMAVTIGLQQIQQTLNKDSAFMLKTVTKAKDLYALATNRLSVALGLSNVAAKALMATLTLGLSVAIGGAIYLTERYISKQKELTKRQEEFTSKVADEAYKTLSAVETLSAKYKSLGDNMKAKEKFVQDNVKAFDDLGVSIRNVSDAENILNENKKKFIEAQIEKAKALAATQIAAEKFKELIQTELKIQETPKTILTGTQRGFGPQPQSQQEIKNPALVKLESEKKGIEGEIKSLYELSDKADSIANEIIKGLGVTGDETMGIIEKLKKELSDLESKKEKSKSGSEILTLNKEIEAKRSELSKYELKESRTSSKDPLVEQLEKKKKLYQDYFNWINSNRPDLTDGARKEFEDLLKDGNTFIDYLEKQAKDLEGKKGMTDDQKKRLKSIRDFIAAEVQVTALDTFEKELTAKLEAAKTTLEKMSILDQSKPGGTTELDKAKQDFINSEKEKTIRDERALTQELLANYAGYLQEKIQFNESYAENKRLLNLAFEKAENDDAKKIALEALTELERQKEQFNNKSGNKDYDELIDRYKSFKQQLDDLVADFDKKVKIALDNGKKELADLILKAKEEETIKLVKSFSNDEVSKYLESLKKSLAIQISISLATGEQTDELFRIKGLIDGINKALKDRKNEDIVEALDFAIRSLHQITSLMGDIDEQTKRLVSGFINVADGIAQIFSGNVFGGANQIIFSIADNLDKQFGLQRRISDLEAERIEYNRQISYNLQTITGELDKQLKILDELSIGEAFNPTIDTLRSYIQTASEELEKLKFDLLKSPPNLKIELDIEHLKKIFKTDDISEALGSAFSEGLISEEQYNLALDYLNTIEDAEERLKRLHEEYRDALLGATAESITDAITQGLLEGKRGIEDFADTFENLMKQAVVNAMMMRSIQPEIDKFMETWFRMANDEDGLTPEDIGYLKKYWSTLVNQFGDSIDELESMFPDLFDIGESANSLSGAVKGVTEQTAGLIAGQMNAIRINQAHALDLMDDQLVHLSEIASNTRYNKKLDLLPAILRELKDRSGVPTRTNRAAGDV